MQVPLLNRSIAISDAAVSSKHRKTQVGPDPEISLELLQALAHGNPNEVAINLVNDLQAAALSLKPELRRLLRAGEEAGALAGIVSGSGPTCVFLCFDDTAASDIAIDLLSSGTCTAAVTAYGPVPGARIK